MRNQDAVMHLLGSRSEAPRLPRSKFVQMRWSDVRSSSALLVSAPHPYRWMTLDPGGFSGWPRPGFANVSLDGPVGGATDVFNLHPGSWAPIAGRTVYARVLADFGTFPASLSDAVGFWLTEEPTPPPLVIGGVAAVSDLDQVPLAATDPSTSAHGVRLRAGYNYVTVHVHDNGAARIQGAETDDIEVWWYDAQNALWCHSTADDLSAAGRGAATASHDFEVYHVPHNMQRVALVNRTGGNTLWVDIIQSRDNR